MKRKSLLVLLLGLLSAIAHTQNVGIGTNAPLNPLHISGNGTLLRLQSTSSTSEIIFYNSVGLVGYAGAFQDEMEIVSIGPRSVHLGASGLHNVTIIPGGNVGLGNTNPTEKLVLNSGNIRLQNSDKGILLNGADRPLITRGFDAFTSGNYNEAGRWGLFMEPSRLTLGIPNVSGKAVEIARYELNSTRTTLLTVNEEGKMRRPASNNSDLLPIVIGNINSNGGIWGGSGNFTVEHPSTGVYYVTLNGIIYDEHLYVVIGTMNQTSNTTAFLYSTQVSGGRLGFLIRQPNNGYSDQDIHFVVYKLN